MEKDIREKMKNYMVKRDDTDNKIKAALFDPLSEAIAAFSEYASKENMAEKHRDMCI